MTTLASLTVAPLDTAGAASSGRSSTPVVAAGSARAYRHGLVPRLGRSSAPSRQATVTAASKLVYGGGITSIDSSTKVGVTTGAPRVYLVFWGSQWGTAGTDGSGNLTLSGDPRGAGPVLQRFFKGLGVGGELWSGVPTQYCEGVATGATTCTSSAPRVGYPTGGALAGVWYDGGSASPAAATGHELAAEAIVASTHFGNVTPSSNRNVQYVIASPTGTDPDGWLSPTTGYCAWHDDNRDATLSGGAATSPNGDIAFTNLPYLPDAGTSCGQDFVNSPGPLDGVTIVEGHEYAETLTDQFPAGGWTDSSGYENGDKCAWISSGAGASQDITLTTGTFAVQSTWGNDGNGGLGGCEISHAIQVAHGPTFTTGAAATFSSTRSQSFVAKATAGTGATVTLTETGSLPAGFTFVPGAGKGTITGIGASAAVGSYPITLTATSSGLSTNQSFTLWVAPTRKFTSAKVATFPHGVATMFSVSVQGTFGASTAGPPVAPQLSEIGALPAGVTFTDLGNGAAIISGTASVIQNYPIKIVAAAGVKLTQSFTLKVT